MPAQARLMFVGGVLLLSSLAQLLTHDPQLFGRLCSIAAVLTVVEKAISYYFRGWHLFVLDFCYWVNVSCFLIPLLFPNGGGLARIAHAVLFLHANGPVALAVPIWNQSLVFHDPERILSVGVHVWPMLVSFCAAWHPFDSASIAFSYRGFKFLTDIPLVFVSYFLWQLAYFLITNVLFKGYMNRNKHLLSSFRWIAEDHSNGINGLIVSMARGLGVFGPNERMSMDDLRSELMFMLIQLIYTVLTVSVSTLIAIGGKQVHSIFMLLIIASSLWNGSAVYIEHSEDDMKHPKAEEVDCTVKDVKQE